MASTAAAAPSKRRNPNHHRPAPRTSLRPFKCDGDIRSARVSRKRALQATAPRGRRWVASSPLPKMGRRGGGEATHQQYILGDRVVLLADSVHAYSTRNTSHTPRRTTSSKPTNNLQECLQKSGEMAFAYRGARVDRRRHQVAPAFVRQRSRANGQSVCERERERERERGRQSWRVNEIRKGGWRGGREGDRARAQELGTATMLA